MKYSDFYEHDYIQREQKLIIDGCVFVFPLSLFIKRKDLYGDIKNKWVRIDEYRRSENWIWGDLRIDFISKITTPHYNHVTEHVESYTLEEFKQMVRNNNLTVVSLDKNDFNYQSAKIYNINEDEDDKTAT